MTIEKYVTLILSLFYSFSGYVPLFFSMHFFSQQSLVVFHLLCTFSDNQCSDKAKVDSKYINMGVQLSCG